ncbi:MAG: single-stranded DNA-binding protein [Bacteroidota bacterium]|jgi:hypothetical protein
MSFSNLKKNIGAQGIKSLQEELEKMSKKYGTSDDRFWKLGTDKAGTGAAVIRFLPESEGETTPWVLMYKHSFKGPTGLLYIENSLTTLNQPDPVSEYNRELWNSKIEANQNIARSQNRKNEYISNILVIKDPANPENEGKVFMYKYGKKIFEKIKSVMFPENDAIEQKEPMNPFCPWTGANFKLKVKRVGDYPNYDQSEFSTKEPLFGGDDAKIEALWKTQYKLSSLLDPSNFKTYEQLKDRLDKVVGLKSHAQPEVKRAAPQVTKPSLSESASLMSDKSSSFSDDDISDDLDYLQQLANED